MVVDDKLVNVRLIKELLTAEGYTDVEVLTDSGHAVAAFAEYKPDLLILDLHMEPQNGFEILRQLDPQIGSREYLPVLVVTGDITRESKERALRAGAMDFLSKPLSSTELLLRVRNLLQTRSLHLALQQERDLLEQKVRDRTMDLEESQHEVLERLAFVAEFRDYATGRHVQRVANMVRKTALQMCMPVKDADLMGKASLLHDVGKVGIPDEILHKPGRLTSDEFDIVKTHVAIGGDILKGSRSNLLKKAEEIALYHHERWNGSGYFGLTGDRAPLSARITAVADVYDALVTERVYKRAWPPQEALVEIADQSGVQFDPDVVDAFMQVIAHDAKG